MELYLVRHGETEPNVPDTGGGAPLSENGLALVRRSAHFAARLGVRVAEIRHSDRLRAIQTAQEFERALGCPRRQVRGLGPDDDINPVRREGTCAADPLQSSELAASLPNHADHVRRHPTSRTWVPLDVGSQRRC